MLARYVPVLGALLCLGVTSAQARIVIPVSHETYHFLTVVGGFFMVAVVLFFIWTAISERLK